MNRKGDCVWQAGATINGVSESHVFLNSTDYSGPILGPGGRAYEGKIDDAGNLLWDGSYAGTGVTELFLNNGDLTSGKFPGLLGSRARGITDSGHIFWLYTDSRSSTNHIMRDMQDVSAEAFGSNPRDIDQLQNYISESGHIAWLARDLATNEFRTFVDSTDVSTSALGDQSGPLVVVGIDEAGGTLWSGAGSNTNGIFQVFLNEFSLSEDALAPGTYQNARALAIGANGQCLWRAQMNDGTYSVFFSTPVPEPGWAAAVLSGLWFTKRSRRRR